MEDLSRYNGEGTVLREAQLTMLKILIEFDRVCKKNNLTYWIDFGTLLGAVRHSGFIPWDDDIDLSMPPDDYRRFKEIAQTELSERFMLQTEVTEPSSQMGGGVFRLRMKDTLYLMGYDDLDEPYNKGIYIDVFESVPTPAINKKVFRFLARRISKAYGFMHFNKRLNFGNIIRFFVFPVSYVFFYHILWKAICLFARRDCEFTPMPRVLYGYPSPRTAIYPLGEITFEGHTFPCPHDPDRRLTDMWGNYMQIPSEEKRRIHSKFICTDTSNCHVGL